MRILPGQFYREVPEKSGPVLGWTVIDVEAGFEPDSNKRGLARVCVIRNDIRTSEPVTLCFSDLRSKIDSGEWTKTEQPVRPRVEIDDLDDTRKAAIREVEAKRFSIIKPILDLGRDALWKHVRSRAMARIATETGVSRENQWQWLCAYWQFYGRVGLRPRARLAGQKCLQARIDQAAKRATSAPESGKTPADFFRPYKTGRKKNPLVQEGKTMTWQDIQICRKAAKKHLFKKSHDGRLRYCYDSAYTALLEDFYGYERESGAVYSIPSKDQFILAVQSSPEFSELSGRIIGDFNLQRDHRQKKGTTQFEVLGPGHVLQIDDVTTKVILLHPNTFRPLGTGNLFVGSDQWSKVIAGGHLTLSGSSFEGVKQLLLNVATPKNEFFKERGLEIDPAFVPASGIFRSVAADGGPIGGTLGDLLPESLCDLSTIAAYRPELKSDIESSFHAYLRQHAQALPGYNRIERHRNVSDPKVIACLTPAEFFNLWWWWVAEYNQRALKGYLPAEALRMEEHERPRNTPSELWTWGLENISAFIQERPLNEIRRALLRKQKGTFTRQDGVGFLGLHYFIDGEAPSFRLKSKPVVIYYSENYILQIYVLIDGELVTATMRRDEAEKFGHLSYADMKEEKRMSGVSSGGARSAQRKAKVKSRRARSNAIHKGQSDIEAAHPDKRIRKLLLKAGSTSGPRKSALQIEKQNAGAKDSRIFPPPETKPQVPAPKLGKLSLTKLLQKN